MALLTRCSRRRRSRWQSVLEQNRWRSELRGSTANKKLQAWHLRCDLTTWSASPNRTSGPRKKMEEENKMISENLFEEYGTEQDRGIIRRQIQTKSLARTTIPQRRQIGPTPSPQRSPSAMRFLSSLRLLLRTGRSQGKRRQQTHDYGPMTTDHRRRAETRSQKGEGTA